MAHGIASAARRAQQSVVTNCGQSTSVNDYAVDFLFRYMVSVSVSDRGWKIGIGDYFSVAIVTYFRHLVVTPFSIASGSRY